MRARPTAPALVATAVLVLACVPGARAQMLEKLKGTTPEQRAAVQTELMASKLDLAPDQKAKIADLNLDFAKRMQPVIESGRP